MAHFIETVVLDELRMGHGGTAVVGFEALVSPPGDPEDQPDPGLVLDALTGIDAPSLVIEDHEQLVRVLTFVIVNPPLIARPERWIEGWFEEPREPPFPPELIEWVRAAIESPLIVAETSPVSKRSLAELSAMGATTTLYFLGGVPVVAVFGMGVGLLLLRGVRQVGGALWEGARPEVVSFGGDAARRYLDLIRDRWGIEHGGPEDRP